MTTPTNLPADYVLIDRKDISQLLVVYPPEVPLDHAKGVAAQLSTVAGADARAERGTIDGKGPVRPVLRLRVTDGGDYEAVLGACKALVSPRLAIGVAVFSLDILMCSCGYVGSRLADFGYVRGFQPPDDEGFMLRVYAGMKYLPIVKILQQSFEAGSHDLTPLLNEIEKMLESIGAHATVVAAQTYPFPPPCTHPD